MDWFEEIGGFAIDMDGLLLDTESLASRCWERAVDACAAQLPEGLLDSFIGLPMRDVVALLRPNFANESDLDFFLQVGNEMYNKQIDLGVPLRPGAMELLQELAARGIPRCLVTSTYRALAERKLEKVGLSGLLPLKVCGDDVTHGKPHPQPYARAAEVLGLEPRRLLALEDSENGLKSALAAGCKAVWIPDVARVSSDIQRKLVARLNSLEELLPLLRI